MNHRQRIRSELSELERRYGPSLDEIPPAHQRTLLSGPISRSIFDRCGARNVRLEMLRAMASGKSPTIPPAESPSPETTTAHAANAGTLF